MVQGEPTAHGDRLQSFLAVPATGKKPDPGRVKNETQNDVFEAGRPPRTARGPPRSGAPLAGAWNGIDSRNPSWTVRDRRAARRRRDGRRVPGQGRAAWARGGAEVSAAGFRDRPGAPRPLRARGEAAGVAQPPQHRGAVRPRAPREPARARPGVGRGRRPRRADRARPDPSRRGDSDRRADRGGAGCGARKGDRAPRPQAGERQGAAGRRGESAGFRPREGVGGAGRKLGPGPVADDHESPDAGGGDSRDGGVHEPGAGARETGGQAGGHLGVRLPGVRDAHRREDVRRGHHHRCDRRGGAGGTRAGGRAAPPRAGGRAPWIVRRSVALRGFAAATAALSTAVAYGKKDKAGGVCRPTGRGSSSPRATAPAGSSSGCARSTP